MAMTRSATDRIENAPTSPPERQGGDSPPAHGAKAMYFLPATLSPTHSGQRMLRTKGVAALGLVTHLLAGNTVVGEPTVLWEQSDAVTNGLHDWWNRGAHSTGTPKAAFNEEYLLHATIFGCSGLHCTLLHRSCCLW